MGLAMEGIEPNTRSMPHVHPLDMDDKYLVLVALFEMLRCWF